MGCNRTQLLLLMIVVALLPYTIRGQSRSARYLTIAVEDVDVYYYLNGLTANTELYRGLFPYVASTGIRLNFTHMPIRGILENVSHAITVQSQLLDQRASAIISDYYISLAMATYTLGIPYFTIRKFVFSFPPPGTPNIFEIEIDNFHMSQALSDVSAVYKRTSLIVISDGTPSSSQFLVNFGGRIFSVQTVTNNNTDDDIYDMFSRYNSNNLPSGNAWILLFDEPNLPLMERTLAQASRAGIFVQSQFFFVPSLFDKESYLTRFYRSDIEFYTFFLPNRNRYTRRDLLIPFILDCLNHFVKAYSAWTTMGINVTISNAIVAEPSIQNPLTGSFTYDPVNKIRSKVHMDVVRSNRSRPVGEIFSLAGSWYDDGSGTPPYTPEYSGADAISRSRIVFAAFEYEPYFYKYDSVTNSARGLCLEIVEAMREQLGFEYKVIRASSQNEVVEMLKNGSADVSLNFLAPTFDRLEYTDLSVDMVQDGIQMLNKKVVHPMNFFHVFNPFSFYVWMSIVIAIFLLSATLYVCDKISPNTRGSPMFSPFQSFFLVLSSFLMSKVETEPKKLSSRLFTLLLWFSTLLYMTTYLSNLVAFLIKPDTYVSFSTVGDLQEISGYKWGYIKNSMVDAEVRTNWPRVHDIAQKQWPELMYMNNIHEAINRVLSDPTFILIASADTLSFIKNQDCKLKVTGSIANSHYLTWLFRRGFRFKQDLNNQLKTRKDTHFAHLRSKYFDLNRCYTGQTDIENKVQLGFNYLCGLFLLLGIGIVLGFLQLLGRWIFDRLQERWNTRRQTFHFKLGRHYQAEVYDVKPKGVWVRIVGDTEVRFLDNSCLYPNADENARPSNSHLRGKMIQLQYIGNCTISGAKIFMRQKHIVTVESAYSESNSDNEDSA